MKILLGFLGCCAVVAGLLLFWQMSENGRYHPVLFAPGDGYFLLVDTRTGAWQVEHFSYEDIKDARKRRGVKP
jgi:hypothetical protein